MWDNNSTTIIILVSTQTDRILAREVWLSPSKLPRIHANDVISNDVINRDVISTDFIATFRSVKNLKFRNLKFRIYSSKI